MKQPKEKEWSTLELKKMTTKDLLFFDVEWNTKEQVISHLIDGMDKIGILTSKEEYYKAVMEREALSPTGMEAGLAIPHGKSKGVKEAKLAVARLKNKATDWESIDPSNEVDLVFLLAIPEDQAGTTHLQLLAELSTRLMNPNYLARLKNAKNADEFLEALDYVETTDNKPKEYTKTVLAVTACSTGIAHTYMAAEALEKAGDELGIRVITEKQGANGAENKHTASRVKEADAVIFATDVAVLEKERFNGMPYIQTRVAEPLRNAKEMLQRVLENPDGKVQAEMSSEEVGEKKGLASQISQAILTGMSYMIPVIVAAGLMIGIARLGAIPFGLADQIHDAEFATDPNQLIMILHHLNLYGNMIFRFMFPVFAAYTAFAIAGRPGLVSGFIGGAFASGLHFMFWGVEGGVPSGFFGAVILGLAAGYISKFLNEKIKLHKNLQAIKPMLLIPAISVLVIFLLNFYIVDPVFGGLNLWLQGVIEASAESGEVILSTIIAAATAFDLGGPVNRAAGAIAIGMAADGIFPLTPRVLAIVIPPIGVGLATVIDKFVVGRRVFSDDLRVAGSTSLVLGFIAISEGALPFMLKNPFITIPINIIGAILGAVTAVLLGAVQWLPLPAIWGWPLVENFPAYFAGLAVGVLFIAFANIFVRFAIIKREEAKEKQ